MKKFVLIALVLVMAFSFTMLALGAPFFGWVEPTVGWNAQLPVESLQTAFLTLPGGPMPYVGWNS